jgi:hypothetical protein
MDGAEITKSRLLGTVVAVSGGLNLVVIAGVVVLLLGGGLGRSVANDLHLATLGQANAAQATANDTQIQLADAQHQISQATGSAQSLGDAISSMQSDISDLQLASDDVDSRVATLETSHRAACLWAIQDQGIAVGQFNTPLDQALSDYELQVC